MWAGWARPFDPLETAVDGSVEAAGERARPAAIPRDVHPEARERDTSAIANAAIERRAPGKVIAIEPKAIQPKGVGPPGRSLTPVPLVDWGGKGIGR